jgi:hypothetical protein
VLGALAAIAQLDGARGQQQIMPGGNEIDVIGLEVGRSVYLRHWNPRPVLQQLAHAAFALGVEVHNYHVGKSAVSGYGFDELL